ncbi:hypothetical protein GDO81_023817 [Engystomops pustulosus]|uniref:Uncharacterized protein n=1 Tax=Engystomops pustulosus TaxID=76066 RepID=A0AAV6YS45_ENGPU|nr:hypothetical protein GDO81_023817 [Engystomops pustulosus]
MSPRLLRNIPNYNNLKNLQQKQLCTSTLTKNDQMILQNSNKMQRFRNLHHLHYGNLYTSISNPSHIIEISLWLLLTTSPIHG